MIDMSLHSMQNRGGDKRSNGKFTFFDGNKLHIGLRHHTMTNLERERFFNVRCKKHGIKLR